jgi:hypothetical protein
MAISIGHSIALVLVALAGCDGAGAGGGEDGNDRDGGLPPAPDPLCEAPLALVDTSRPDRVVGDGSAASCTEAALQSAVAAGGVITFACGDAAHAITVTAPLRATVETVLDGGGLVTLDGGGATRILELDSGFDVDTPTLTVQRLGFVDGRSGGAGGDDTARGGGAIYRDGGSLVVIDSIFQGNHAPATGQDVAGGAIYGFGGGAIVVIGSTFAGNGASNGGAIGGLQSDLTVVNSTLVANQASGSGGNPGNGGTGGAIYQDGIGEATTICGTTLEGNRAGAIGGALFRVSNTGDGSFVMERSAVLGNAVAEADTSLAGGMYLQGVAISIAASTVASNRAGFGGGLWLGQGATVDLRNVTVAGNEAFTSHGGGLWLAGEPTGTILNCTIADNAASGSGSLAGAIFGGAPGLTLRNTLIARQSADLASLAGCDARHGDGGGNLQWPDLGGDRCTTDVGLADPRLGELGDHGGPTPTLVPAAGSPAIGAATGCPPTDQRGEPRGEPCTSGAVEVP